ncbi:MAG: hypothetical protein LBQ88_08840 [Treponema sp.]|jgi:hypothetical protein|nr:hypothetical protein [Treponema sp.]
MFHKEFSTEEKRKIAGFGPGDTVIYFERASEEQIRWGGNDDPEKFLTVGEEYTVKDVEIHSYHTKVFLEGIEGKFNSVSFRAK